MSLKKVVICETSREAINCSVSVLTFVPDNLGALTVSVSKGGKGSILPPGVMAVSVVVMMVVVVLVLCVC